MEKTKKCTKCGYDLLLEEFYCPGDDPNRSISWCKSCMSKAAVESNRKRHRERLRKGLCRICGKGTLKHSKHFCAFHYVDSTIRNAIGYRSKNTARVLYFKLCSQDFTCPYTGEELVLGVNAQIDHILPRSRFPESRTLIENLEWVSKKANLAKHNLTKDEFLELCRLVAGKFPR